MAMEKQTLIEMDMDPTTFICVNPYEVNPILESTILHSPALTVDVPLKGEPHIAQRTWDATGGRGFYGPNKKVKLEMEEFSDLSSFLPPKLKSANSVDELNTPVFDKDAFDFNVNVCDKDQSEDLFVKLECDAYYKNTCIITDNNQFKNFSLNAAKVHLKENLNSTVANMLSNSDINAFLLKSENESVYTNCEISPPSYENITTPICNVDDNSALSVSNDRHYSFISSPEEMIQQLQNGFETPEDSNSSSVFMEPMANTRNLTLNISLKQPATELGLNTPAILDEVVNLESANFNILDLVPEEEISYVNEEIFSPTSTVTLPSVEDTTSSFLLINDFVPEKRARKRRYADDDEDYVPPTKKNAQQRKQVIREDSDSDSDSEAEVKPKRKARGRPPKRTDSISSDCSKEGDASKYRELRDKNNEASRKSRLKRKTKEAELETEGEQLLRRNIKLKAQVEELEKMVTNFRDNLFKIMIKK